MVRAPDGIALKLCENPVAYDVGCILERKIFDRDLAALTSPGARVMIKARATGLLFKYETFGREYQAGGPSNHKGRWCEVQGGAVGRDVRGLKAGGSGDMCSAPDPVRKVGLRSLPPPWETDLRLGAMAGPCPKAQAWPMWASLRPGGSPSSAGLLALRLPEAFAKLLHPDGKALELVAG